MSTNQEVTRKTVVITGTSRGIGKSLATTYLDQGYRVIGISRSNTDIKDPNFRSVQTDMSDLDQVSKLKLALRSETISGLINNAGIHLSLIHI